MSKDGGTSFRGREDLQRSAKDKENLLLLCTRSAEDRKDSLVSIVKILIYNLTP